MRTMHKTLIVAMATALMTSGALYAQVKDASNGKAPEGPSNGGTPITILPGQTCFGANGSNCPGAIPDYDFGNSQPGKLTSTFEMTACSTPIRTATVGLDVTHTWVGDLAFTLTAPDGTPVTIVDQPGVPATFFGCAGHDIFAVLDDTAGSSVENECAAATPTIDGTFIPNNPLSAFNGLAGNGTWTMEVSDSAGGDTGTLNNWSVNLDCGQSESKATFQVNKVFADGNTADVDVTLSCFTGLPLVQSQTIAGDQNVKFIVQSFADGELDCSVTEADVTGYSGEYDNGYTSSDVDCSYDNVTFGQANNCTITNSPDPVAIKVTKDWVIDGDGGDYLDASYKLVLKCNDEIVDGNQQDNGKWKKTLYNNDTNGTADTTYTGYVVPDWDGGTSCSVEETVYDSSVDVTNGCETGLVAKINTPDSCTIVNTVFYEGIPTLSQTGMAILALLMLGVGFVGFRRFT